MRESIGWTALAIVVVMFLVWIFLPAGFHCKREGHSLIQLTYYPDTWACSRCGSIVFVVRPGPSVLGLPDTVVVIGSEKP
jgi:hypothetical protein